MCFASLRMACGHWFAMSSLSLLLMSLFFKPRVLGAMVMWESWWVIHSLTSLSVFHMVFFNYAILAQHNSFGWVNLPHPFVVFPACQSLLESVLFCSAPLLSFWLANHNWNRCFSVRSLVVFPASQSLLELVLIKMWLLVYHGHCAYSLWDKIVWLACSGVCVGPSQGNCYKGKLLTDWHR